VAVVDGGLERVAACLDAVHLKEGLREAMSVAQAGNRYFDERAPWVQVKQDPPAAASTIATLLNALDGIKVLFSPFVPFSSEKLHGLLGWEDELAEQGWRRRALPGGQQLPKPTPLFVKLEVPAEE
jgi:methionyl-tRNA synthetase